MSAEDQPSHRERAVTSMLDPAEELHVSAGTCTAVRRRHRTRRPLIGCTLGDDVTEQADDIDRRADQLEPDTTRGVATAPEDLAD